MNNNKIKNNLNKWFWHSLSITAILLLCIVAILGAYNLNIEIQSTGLLDLTEIWGGDREVLRVTLFDMKDKQLEILFEGNYYSSTGFRVGDSVQIQRAWGNNTGELSYVLLTEEMFSGGYFRVPLVLFKENLIYGAY